jgi:hypothetical protein
LATGTEFNEVINATTSILYQAQNGSIIIYDTIEVEAHPLPDIDLGNDTLICSGADIILNAGAQESYLWSDNSTAQTLSPDLFTVGSFSFSVSVENQFGCISEDDINIEVQDCALLSELNTEEIIFYPNPFRDVVYSNVNLEDYEIAIYDVLGRTVNFHLINQHSLRIDSNTAICFIKLNDLTMPILSTPK